MNRTNVLILSALAAACFASAAQASPCDPKKDKLAKKKSCCAASVVAAPSSAPAGTRTLTTLSTSSASAKPMATVLAAPCGEATVVVNGAACASPEVLVTSAPKADLAYAFTTTASAPAAVAGASAPRANVLVTTACAPSAVAVACDPTKGQASAHGVASTRALAPSGTLRAAIATQPSVRSECVPAMPAQAAEPCAPAAPSAPCPPAAPAAPAKRSQRAEVGLAPSSSRDVLAHAPAAAETIGIADLRELVAAAREAQSVEMPELEELAIEMPDIDIEPIEMPDLSGLVELESLPEGQQAEIRETTRKALEEARAQVSRARDEIRGQMDKVRAEMEVARVEAERSMDSQREAVARAQQSFERAHERAAEAHERAAEARERAREATERALMARGAARSHGEGSSDDQDENAPLGKRWKRAMEEGARGWAQAFGGQAGSDAKLEARIDALERIAREKGFDLDESGSLEDRVAELERHLRGEASAARSKRSVERTAPRAFAMPKVPGVEVKPQILEIPRPPAGQAPGAWRLGEDGKLRPLTKTEADVYLPKHRVDGADVYAPKHGHGDGGAYVLGTKPRGTQGKAKAKGKEAENGASREALEQRLQSLRDEAEALREQMSDLREELREASGSEGGPKGR